MRRCDPMMYEAYDNYLQHLWEKAEQLEAIRQELQKKLDEELQKLVKCEQAVKVLEKHKEKNKRNLSSRRESRRIKTIFRARCYTFL